MEQRINSKSTKLIKLCYGKCQKILNTGTDSMWKICLKSPAFQKYKIYYDYCVYFKDKIKNSKITMKCRIWFRKGVLKTKQRLQTKAYADKDETATNNKDSINEDNANVIGVVKHVMSGLSRKKTRPINLLKLKKSTSLDNIDKF